MPINHIPTRLMRISRTGRFLAGDTLPAKRPRLPLRFLQKLLKQKATSALSFSNSILCKAIFAFCLISACLALPAQAVAQDAPAIGSPETATSEAPAAGGGGSAAILRVIALRQELEAQVKALRRIAAYQTELLDLAKTRDSEAVLRARRQRQSCYEDIKSARLCDALGTSFGNDVQDRGAE